ncbi:MAG: AMP-binding protein [Sulfolobales archaeon]
MLENAVKISYSIDIFDTIGELYSARTAIIEYENNNKYNYNDLIQRSLRVAKYLSDLSIKAGDKIATLLMNRIEYIELFIASRKIGSVLVPINWRLTPGEIKAIIRDVEPKAVIYEPIFRELVERSVETDLASKIIKIVTDSEPLGPEYSYDDALRSQSIKGRRNIDFEEPAMILFTGGTTGVPKGAVIPYRQIFYNIVSEILTWRLKEDHKTIVLLPLFHTGGWNLLTLPLLVRGGLLYLVKKFDPKIFLEIVETSEGPMVIFAVPTIYYMIMKADGFKETRFDNVEWMLSGGAPIDKRIMEEYWSKGVKMAQGYGITEGGPNNITMPIYDLSLEDIKARWKSVGKPFAFNVIKIIGHDGRELGPNEYGEIVICGPLIFSGYWKRDEETASILRNGCVYTGDIGFYDVEGYFYVIDRKKDIIKSGGEQIYPREIEELVLQHPSVEDCAVIGVPDEKWGEVPKLIIKLKPMHKISKEEIIQFLAGKIARYKIPKYIAVVDEIPKSPAGKTLKRVLIERHGMPRDEL